MPSGHVKPHAPTMRPRASRRQGFALRARVWLNASELDSALADGADPTENNALALRAEQLADARTRHRVAGAIDNVLAMARVGATPQLSLLRVPFRSADIQANRPLLVDSPSGFEAGARMPFGVSRWHPS